MIKRFMVALALLAMLAPQISLAATPQQLLDRATTLSLNPQPRVGTLDFNLSFHYRPVVRGEQMGDVKVHIILTNEQLPRGQGMMDSDQRLRVESFSLSAAPELGIPAAQTWKDPISFESKMISGVSYVRIASISDELRTLIQGAQIPGFDLNNVVGRWLRIDKNSIQQALKDVLPMEAMTTLPSIQNQQDLLRTWRPVLQKAGLLRAIRLESKTTRQGIVYDRIQFQINTRLWTDLENLLRKQIEMQLVSLKVRDRKAYNAEFARQTTELRTLMNTFRREVAKIRFIAVVNERTGEIERVEAAGKTTQPDYREEYVNGRFVKRLKGYNEFTYSFVSALRRVSDHPVAAPTDFVTVESLIQWFKDKLNEPTVSLSE